MSMVASGFGQALEDIGKIQQSTLRAPRWSGATVSGSWRCPDQTVRRACSANL